LSVSFVTVHSKCSKIPPATPLNFASCVQRWHVVCLGWSSCFLLWTVTMFSFKH